MAEEREPQELARNTADGVSPPVSAHLTPSSEDHAPPPKNIANRAEKAARTMAAYRELLCVPFRRMGFGPVSRSSARVNRCFHEDCLMSSALFWLKLLVVRAPA